MGHLRHESLGDPFSPPILIFLITGDPSSPSRILLIKYEVTHFPLRSDPFYPTPCKTAICFPIKIVTHFPLHRNLTHFTLHLVFRL